MELLKKLNSLDEKISPSAPKGGKARIFMNVIAGTFIGALVDLVGFCGAINYNECRNEYTYREAEHISAPRYIDTNSIRFDSEANKFLVEFPIEIPGAARVDKYVTSGARYCLVHVRQEHLAEDISEEDLRKVGIVQRDIYQILSYLIENHRLSEVYSEGLIPVLKNISDLEIEVVKLLDEVDNDGSNRKRLKEMISERTSELEKMIKASEDISSVTAIGIALKYLSDLGHELEQKKGNRYQYEAVKKAAFNHGIKIIPAETLGGKLNASHAITKEIEKGNKDPRLFKILFDDREDILLDAVAKQQKNPLVVCVYGGAHVWGGYYSFGKNYPLALDKSRNPLKDNLYEWNQQHPDKKYSLIEITPEHYPKE